MAKTPSNKLTLKHIVGYGCGDAGGTVTLYMVSGYMSRYLQVHLGVDAAMLAVILLIWNIWDAVNDPLMGTLIDLSFAKSLKKNPSADRCRPWIIRSIPVMAIGMIAFYNVPRFLDGIAMVAAAFILKVVYEAGYTMMNIGMGSLLGNMATNDNERATLSSARGFGSTIAGLLGGVTIPLCISAFGDTAEGYGITAIVTCAIGMVLVFLHYALTEERTKAAPVEKTPEQEEADKIKVTDILVVFKKNRAFLALVLHSICICFVQGMGQGASSYMFADVLNNISIQAVASLLSTGLMIVVLTAAPILTKKFDLVDIIRVCLVIGGAFYAITLVYAFTVGTANMNAWVYVILMSLAAAGVTMSVQMQWGLVAESIDYIEYLTGKRNEGSIYGMFSFSRRFGSMLASSAAVLVIDWIGYDTAAKAAGLAQSQGVLDGLTIMCVALPIVAAIGSFCCFTFIWNLKGDVRAKMADWRAAKAGK